MCLAFGNRRIPLVFEPPSNAKVVGGQTPSLRHQTGSALPEKRAGPSSARLPPCYDCMFDFVEFGFALQGRAEAQRS
jgi:hypothetical protein